MVGISSWQFLRSKVGKIDKVVLFYLGRIEVNLTTKSLEFGHLQVRMYVYTHRPRGSIGTTPYSAPNLGVSGKAWWC